MRLLADLPMAFGIMKSQKQRGAMRGKWSVSGESQEGEW